MRPKKRWMHPCDRPLKRQPFAYVVLEAVREALFTPAHPDSSRQRRAKQEARERRAARRMKAKRSGTQDYVPKRHWLEG